MIKKFLDYLSGVRAELTHVKWPSRGQGLGYTALVIIISIATAAILGGADFGFARLTELIVGR